MASDKTILHVPRRFVADEWGGTETVIVEISRQQQRDGWQPKIFTSLALSGAREETIDDVPVRRFGYCYPYFGLSEAERFAMDKKGGNLLSFSLFAALLREPGVRLFHAHTLKRLGGEVLTAARLRRRPVVVTLHGGVFDVPAAEQKNIVEPSEGKLEWGKPFGALFRSRRLLEEADHVICVGRGEYDQAKKQLGHDRISFLPNGVDPEKFARVPDGFRAKHGIPSDAFLILNLSRIDEQKNQLLLVEAFARLRRTRPEAFLLLVGPETQPSYARRLRDVIRAHALDRSVKILPGLRHADPDLPAAYHSCDVFVLPSTHEPFGIVVLEAWCCRKPVIAARVGGLASLVRDGETGLHFDPASAEELVSRLDQLAERPGLRARLGEKGFDEVSRRYTWNSVTGQLESIYAAAESKVKKASSGF